ncbi:uncharacterized protein G2W53_029007 [Senna tora]|uniref:Uncharacterized protein n=1 Tax=Senna tora TaxID=362788 RepID=A0A834T4G4_9FABA|nr:uncharacterized protein G2W53_029007 [Senna tora]
MGVAGFQNPKTEGGRDPQTGVITTSDHQKQKECKINRHVTRCS